LYEKWTAEMRIFAVFYYVAKSLVAKVKCNHRAPFQPFTCQAPHQSWLLAVIPSRFCEGSAARCARHPKSRSLAKAPRDDMLCIAALLEKYEYLTVVFSAYDDANN
jgi:hypothetical protein